MTEQAVNNPAFLKNISWNFPGRTSRYVADFFDTMNMPIPDAPEYTPANDNGGFLVFLDDIGCVLRGSDKYLGKVKHPLMIPPLFEKTVRKMRISLYPGVETPISAEDLKKFQKILKSENIEFHDDFPENAGYLPVETEEFPNGMPVVIDLPAACKARNFSRMKASLKRRFPEAFEALGHGPQQQRSFYDSPYQCLQDAFGAAWPKEQERPDQSLLRKAWALCVQKREEGLLIPDWQNLGQEGKMPADFKNAKRGGALYAKKWDF